MSKTIMEGTRSILRSSQRRAKISARIRRMKGQIDAVDRLVATDASCYELLQVVASIRGALNGLTVELIEDHIHQSITDEEDGRQQTANDLIEVIRAYLK